MYETGQKRSVAFTAICDISAVISPRIIPDTSNRMENPTFKLKNLVPMVLIGVTTQHVGQTCRKIQCMKQTELSSLKIFHGLKVKTTQTLSDA